MLSYGTSSNPAKAKSWPACCGPVLGGRSQRATSGLAGIGNNAHAISQYIINNGRFILPSVQVKELASAILARSARQLAHNWRQHYGYTAAFGNLGRCRKISWNLLSRCELDLPRPDYRRNSDGPSSSIESKTANTSLYFRCTAALSSCYASPIPPLPIPSHED